MFLPVGEKQAGIAAAMPGASPSLSGDLKAVDEQVCVLFSSTSVVVSSSWPSHLSHLPYNNMRAE